MTAQINRKAFADALGLVRKAVLARHSIPILNHVFLRVGDGKLLCAGTDFDIEIRASLECSGDGFETTVNAETFSRIVRSCGGENVSLDLKNDRLHINDAYDLPTLPAEEYPDFEATEYDCNFEADVAGLFGPAAYAISTDYINRPYLTGAYLHAFDGKLRAVSTDGAQMCIRDANLPKGAEDMPGAIVPAKTVSVVPVGKVAVSVSEKRILFTNGTVAVASSLCEGTFPDPQYRRIVPDTKHDARVDREALMAAAERLSVVSRDSMEISFAPGILSLEVKNPETGNGLEKVACEYDGEPLTAKLNPKYLANALRSFTSEMILAAPGGTGQPIKFTAPDDPAQLAVVHVRRI